MKRKIKTLDLGQYVHLFKDGRAGLNVFLDVLRQLKKEDPNGVVHIINGSESVCDINFKIPKWAYEQLPKHRPIDADWSIQFDENE